MNRRQLFGRVAAIAAAVAVAPAGKVEAAPAVDPPLDLQSWDKGYAAGLRSGEMRREGYLQVERARHQEALVQARAEGYERGRAVEQAKRESRALAAYDRVILEGEPLPFEAMQADCEARGCWLNVGSDDHWLHAEFDRRETPKNVTALQSLIATDLARVDAWRCSLHEQVI